MRNVKRAFREYKTRLRTRYLLDIIFVHINKTGGSSIERALGLPFQHRTALELRNDIGRARWERRFSFSFVRNPWDKVASHYAFRVQTNQTRMRDDPIEFNEWVRLAYGERVPRYYDQPKMFMPQTDWLADESGQIIVRYIGRFERLEEDFREVCAIVGRDAALPHLKKSARADYRRMYAPDTVDLIARRFQKDIENFGYTFE